MYLALYLTGDPPGDMGSKVAVIVGSSRRSFPTDATDVGFFSRVDL